MGNELGAPTYVDEAQAYQRYVRERRAMEEQQARLNAQYNAYITISAGLYGSATVSLGRLPEPEVLDEKVELEREDF